METLVRLAVIAASSHQAASRAGLAGRQTAIVVALALLAGLLGLAALGCAAAALWLEFLPIAGPVVAPLVVAGALLLLALAAFVTLRRLTARAAAEAEATRSKLVAQALDLVKDHKGAALLAALLAGLAAGKGEH
jgi:hypothetical protein